MVVTRRCPERCTPINGCRCMHDISSSSRLGPTFDTGHMTHTLDYHFRAYDSILERSYPPVMMVFGSPTRYIQCNTPCVRRVANLFDSMCCRPCSTSKNTKVVNITTQTGLHASVHTQFAMARAISSASVRPSHLPHPIQGLTAIDKAESREAAVMNGSGSSALPLDLS